jgi:ABC-2 type transport system permease protein
MLRIAQKELRDILREKSILVALLVQFFIAAFSAFLAVGLMALYDPASTQAEIRADAVYAGPGGFDEYLQRHANLRLSYADAESALASFSAGRVDLVVQESIADTHTVTLLLPDGRIQTTLLVTQLKGLLQEYETDLREAGQNRLQHELLSLPAPPRDERPLPYAFLYSTLVPLLFVTPVFLGGAIAADSLAAELQSRTLTILRSTPRSIPSLLIGKLLVPVVLAPLQFLLWAGLLWLNAVPVRNLLLLCAASLLLTALLAGTGYALAARLRRDGPTQAAYAFTAITLAAVSLLMPRDPLNLVAVLATGRIDAQAWTSLLLLAAASVTAVALGTWDAARGIRKRPD